jgi:hypothetical protein
MALSANKSLEQVVKDYMIERGFESLHGFSRYLNMAIQGLKILERDVSSQVQKCELSVSSALTADLPSNCVKTLGFAILKNNTFYPLTHSYDQAPVGTDSSGDDTVSDNEDSNAVTGIGVGFYTTTTTNLHGEFIGRIYGLSGRQNGTYSINQAQNRVEFNRNFSTKNPVYVFFIGNPEKIDGKYRVNEINVEAIKAYIHWADMRYKRSGSTGAKEQAKMDWSNAKLKAIADHSSKRRTDLEDIIRKNFKMLKF